MKNRVFVTQENPSINYSDAEKYGDVVFLSFREYAGIRGSISDREMRNEIRRTLSTFDPDNDYLLFTGSPIITGFVFHEVMKIAGRARVLRWRKRNSEYEVAYFGEEE